MAACLNHPVIETDAGCARCAQPYCDACLVDFMGQRFCGPCRDYKLYEMQHPGGPGAVYSGTGTVDMGRWLGAGWNIISQDLATWAVATFLFFLLTGCSIQVCYGPLSAGLYMMAFRKMTYGNVEIGNVFDGFQRFLNAFLLVLLVAVVVGVVSFGVNLGTTALQFIDTSNRSLPFISVMINYGLSVPIQGIAEGFTFFALAHVAARNANPIDALSASWEVIRRNPLMFVICGIVFTFISLAGTAAFCIGILVTYPLTMAAVAQAYADHFGIDGWDRS